MFRELHGSTTTAAISTLPELGAAGHVPRLPILDAEPVAAQHQVELMVVHSDHAAHAGSGNLGASADEDWAALNANFRRVAMVHLAQSWSSSRRSAQKAGFGPDRAWERQAGAEAAQHRGADHVAWDQGAAEVRQPAAWRHDRSSPCHMKSFPFGSPQCSQILLSRHACPSL